MSIMDNERLASLKIIAPMFVFLSASVGFFSYALLDYIKLSNAIISQDNQLSQLKQRVEQGINHEQQLVRYQAQLILMAEKGYIGEPQRLGWLQVLRETVAKFNLPQVRFTLSPTINESALSGDEYTEQDDGLLSLTSMALDMQLMHERDFYDFMTTFKDRAPGVFRVDDCEIKKTEENTSDKPIHLTASCELTWLSYHDIRQDWEPMQ